jgi:hypothetical protein
VSVATVVLAGTDGHAARPASGLVDVVLRATEQFQDPEQARPAGYVTANACVSGPEEGAMGVHFINGELVGNGELDPEHPEALIYEQRRGRARLVGVEYIVLAEAWHANHAPTDTPVLMGQLLHFVDSPNRYGLPPFYELHVWAWRDNPKGTFVDWNPRVSCAEFEPEASVSTAQAHTHDGDAGATVLSRSTRASSPLAR